MENRTAFIMALAIAVILFTCGLGGLLLIGHNRNSLAAGERAVSARPATKPVRANPDRSSSIDPDEQAAAAAAFLGFSVSSLVCLALFTIPVYFIPSFVAMMRNHQNTAAIVVLNLLTGWTFVGYVAALVWSFTVVESPRQRYQARMESYDNPFG